MAAFKKERKMKVYEATRAVQNAYYSSKYERVPQIRLQGQWLEQLGFEPGSLIVVECKKRRLTISRVDEVIE